jgi:hypothetical protein
VTGAVRRALVVGGGIGGLAVAGALGCRGVEVDVVDNQPAWAIARSGIALQAPALRALDALGLIDAVVEGGFGMTAFRYHDSAGTLRATSELPRLAGPGRPGTVGIMRGTLHGDHARRRGGRGRARAPRHDGPGALGRRRGRAVRRLGGPLQPRRRRRRRHPLARARASRGRGSSASCSSATLAAGDDDVPGTLAAFADRRYERCALVVEESVARTEGIIRPAPDFDVAAFERRVWGELAKPY